MLRFKDMFPYGIEYRPGEDELVNYRALRRKRTIGIGEGGPIGEAVQKEQENPVDAYIDKGKHAKGVSVGYPYKHKIIKDPTGKHKIKVHQYQSEDIDVDEALTVQQRLKKARDLRKNKARIALGRRRAARRMASPEVLQRRARKAAYKVMYTRITKGIPKDELSPQRKAEIEKRLEKPAVKARIDRIARKMLKDVRKRELERKRGGGNKE